MLETLDCRQNAGLATISDLAERLLHTLNTGCDVEIDASGVELVDISFIQTIEAARQQAAIVGQSLRLAAPANAVLANVLEQSGLLWDRAPADLQFWFHQREDA
jgi:anti-anti-sigma regulatory factor